MTRTALALVFALVGILMLAAQLPAEEPAHTDPEAARQIARFYMTDGYTIETEDETGVYLSGFYETCRITANETTHTVTCWAE